MKTESPYELPTYEVMGHKLRIHFNHTPTTHEGVDGEIEQGHSYSTAVVDKNVDRETIIEAIMRVKYPTYGAEIAAMQNGDPDNHEHQVMRDAAKSLADGWFKNNQIV